MASMRTDDAREGEEGSDALRSRVGFEVLELEVGHRHLWIVLLLIGCVAYVLLFYVCMVAFSFSVVVGVKMHLIFVFK